MPRWTGEMLDAKRRIGDPLADAVIRDVFEKRHVGELNAFMGRLVGNDTIPADLPPEIAAFVRETSALPPWADPARIERAEALFDRHALISLATLVCASLPQCYTIHRGVRILDLTQQLGQHTNRRIHQTAVMVIGVMAVGGLTGHGRGIRDAQKVRLIHAAIRYRILAAIGAGRALPSAGATVPVVIAEARRSVNDVIAHGQFDWQIDRDGFPINQEDLAITLLTFGHVIPLGMRTLGVPVSRESHAAFLHTWNVVGSIMGIDEALMAHAPEEADELFALIRARQAGPSAAGERLTASLIAVVQDEVLKLRVLKPLAPILVRMLVGDDTARLLGLDTRHHWTVVACHRAAAALVLRVNRLGGRVAARFHPARPLATLLGQRLIDLLCRITYTQSRVALEIPSLAEKGS